MRNQDHFRGCLIGGAAGDALGYAVEFMPETRIFQRYGEQGITAYDLVLEKALVSDDTQMTLFTAMGLLRSGKNCTTEEYRGHIHNAYLDWLKTQNERYPYSGGKDLLTIPELFHRRAPGTTCMMALESGRCGSVDEPINHSKGCGGVMRAAPVGLYFCSGDKSAEETARVGAEAAAVTHGHCLGWMPAGMLAQMIFEIVRNDRSIPDAAYVARYTLDEMWPDSEEKDHLIRLIDRAMDLAAGNKEDLTAIHQLGEGWVAEETLAIALYCAMKYENDFDRAIIAAVNHKGDSDSTGAVTGNIIGAELGLERIPEKYTEKLELRDVIIKVADDLYTA